MTDNMSEEAKRLKKLFQEGQEQQRQEHRKKEEPKGRPPLPQKIAEAIPETDAGVLEVLNVSPERAEEIAAMPQTMTLPSGEVVRNPEWLASRRPKGIPRFTGSVFGEVLGYSPFRTQEAGLEELVNPTFTGNFFTQWGLDHEDVACARSLKNGSRKNIRRASPA